MSTIYEALSDSAPQISCQCLDKRYYVLDKVGEGSFATVYRAIHKRTNFEVAIKAVSKWRCIEKERSTMKSLSHPNLCTLYETMECAHHVFLIMEYCSGYSLFRFMQSRGGGGLPEHIARTMLHQIISAVAYMHREGYVHRDLKDENIMLTADNQVKIIDFGYSAKLETIAIGSRFQNYVGTLGFMAPEIFRNRVYNPEKVDIWSIGVVFYIMLTGSEPFEWDLSNVDELKRKVIAGRYRSPENISQEASQLLQSMLKVSPFRRPTAQEVLDDPYFQTEEAQDNPDNIPENSAGEMGTTEDCEEKLIASTLDEECMKKMKKLFRMKKHE